MSTKKELVWTAPLYMFIPKTTDWYWIVGIISATIAIVSTMLGNITFSILIIIGVIVTFLNAHKEPKTVTITINSKGIKIDDKIYFFDELESFWVENNNLYPRIIFKQNRIIFPFMKVLIHSEDADEAREFLREYLPEEYMNENIIEKIFIYFGF